ncbi:MAG: molybdopterin-guanine dinucleotide biosynthesis protein B [Pseudomonadota bacterium]
MTYKNHNNKFFMICGMSNSGKTEIICRLLKYFNEKNLKICTVKHAHKNFDIDHKHKDSWKYRQAGSLETLIVSQTRWALMHETRIDQEKNDLYSLLKHLSHVDLVLIEGFKKHPFPKIEVRQPNYQGVELWRQDPTVLAVIGQHQELLAERKIKFFSFNEIEKIGQFIMQHAVFLNEINPKR